MSTPDAEVLAWINDVRRKYILGAPLAEIPCGKLSTGYTCPIARALKVRGRSGGGYAGSLGVTLPTGTFLEYPEEVCQFVADFDNGEYPELVA